MLVKASRSAGLEAVVEALVAVKLVLASGVVAMLLGIVSGPALIAFLRRHEFGQHIREDGPAGHQSKQGTPTMGGVGLLACALFAFLIFTERTGAGAGRRRHRPGLCRDRVHRRLPEAARRAVAGPVRPLEAAPAGRGGGGGGPGGAPRAPHHRRVRADPEHLTSASGPPTTSSSSSWSPGAANAVNLTDGLDGLAAGTVTIAALTYAAMMVVAFLAHNGVYPGHTLHGVYVGNPRALDLAIIAAALAGGCIGFLWYNAYPADVFMGDTGAFGLGGGLAALAIFTKTEVAAGGDRRRVRASRRSRWRSRWSRSGCPASGCFLMAPIHHHFEMMEWTENKIIVRFWIAAAMFGASGFVLYYLFFSKYR